MAGMAFFAPPVGFASHAGEFKGRDDDNAIISASWEWVPSKPKNNENGVTGWALVNGISTRLHVCGKNPCIARYTPSKYGNLPVPIHMRLIKPELAATLDAGSAVAEPEALVVVGAPPPEAPAASGIVAPELAVPEAPAMAGAPVPTPLEMVGATLPEPAAPDTPAIAGTTALGAAEDGSIIAEPEIEAPIIGGLEEANRLAVDGILAPSIATPETTAMAGTITPELAAPGTPAIVGSTALGAAEEAPPPSAAAPLGLPLSPPVSVLQPLVPDGPGDTMVAPGAPLGTTTGVAHDALSIVSEDVVDGVGETSAYKTSAIVEQVVALARGMALPGTYVGQAAFLLLALKRRMRVHLWIGARRVDIIEDYAPWAKSFCQIEAHADAILSKVTVDETTGSAQMHRVIDHGSVNDASHLEACIPCGHLDEGAGAIGHLDEGAGAIVDVETENEDMVGYYMSRGRMVVHTVRDGNCAFDAMCVMVGMPRTDATIWDMRFEVAEFLMNHAENAALHRALKTCCEVDLPIDPWDNLAEHNAPLLFRDDDLEASDDDATPAIAGCVDARAFPDSVLDAVAWASGIRQCSREKALGLCRALPNWCIDEQVKKYNARPTSSRPTPINKSIVGKTRTRVRCWDLASARRKTLSHS